MKKCARHFSLLLAYVLLCAMKPQPAFMPSDARCIWAWEPVAQGRIPLINEFVTDDPGADDLEFIEIYGEALTDYSSYTLLQLEGDGAGAGSIDSVHPLGSTDQEGFWTTPLFWASVLENGSLTLLLVTDFSGKKGDDLDANNDGMLELNPWSELVDAVGKSDGGNGDLLYAATVLQPGFDTFGGPVAGASRIPDGQDTDQPADWMRNDPAGAGFEGLAGTPESREALNSPGERNAAVGAVTPGEPPLAVTHFSLIDADTDEEIGLLSPPALLDLASLAGVNLSIRAHATAQTESVRLQLQGPFNGSRTENETPYALFGDMEGNYAGKQLKAGIYTLRATPFSGNDKGGAEGPESSLIFIVSDPGQRIPAIQDYTLLNAEADADILTLSEGEQIHLPSLSTAQLNIRANVSEDTQSVQFELRGEQHHNSTENVFPYALFGDINGNYLNGNLRAGTYTLTAIPFSGKNRKGVPGIPSSIRFHIQEQHPVSAYREEEVMRVYPNPARTRAVLRFDPAREIRRIGLFDMFGKLIRTYDCIPSVAGEEYPLDLDFIVPGMYIIRSEDGYGREYQKILLIQ